APRRDGKARANWGSAATPPQGQPSGWLADCLAHGKAGISSPYVARRAPATTINHGKGVGLHARRQLGLFRVSNLDHSIDQPTSPNHPCDRNLDLQASCRAFFVAMIASKDNCFAPPIFGQLHTNTRTGFPSFLDPSLWALTLQTLTGNAPVVRYHAGG